ncbi:YjfB family protein [Domibacillus sp. A3M-37]|uniref:YjfB family protein n=1 Tax=Domibacillus TaxID=1433999 RepID=UPI0009E2AC21|nr:MULTISPECIES: YjfB family protein [Domibacillus]MCP3760920.1 YjfB family protein [Domibacillus sp. A3M-37]
MDIAALSMGMSQASLGQNIGLALTKKTMDMAQQNANQMVQMLQAPHPTLGNSIDVKG